MKRFAVLPENVWHQFDEHRFFDTLADASLWAEACGYPQVVVEYKGHTSVKYETKFVTEPSDPFVKGEKR
jgi:hypothetical protein